MEWISVKDQLPPLDTNILAACSGAVWVMCYSDIKVDGEIQYVWGIVYDGLRGDPVYDDNYFPTHWMHIPEPPKST